MVNKICEVFTREYKKETEYREFMENMLHSFELNNQSENIEDIVNRLIKSNFVSNFKIKVGDYE